MDTVSSKISSNCELWQGKLRYDEISRRTLERCMMGNECKPNKPVEMSIRMR